MNCRSRSASSPNWNSGTCWVMFSSRRACAITDVRRRQAKGKSMEERWKSLAARCESEPYCKELGVAVEELEEGRARLRLPYHDKNSNPGQALHGGVAASMIDIAGTLAAWTGFSGEADAAAIDVAVNYLAAAIGEEIFAEARVLRRGKEITY